MKRIFLLLGAVISVYTAAQDQNALTNKAGSRILPEKGNWSVGIDATPFLRYLGNIFSNAVNTPPDFGFTSQNPGSLYGKYFISDNKAYRFALTLGTTLKSENLIISNNDDQFNVVKQSAFSLGIAGAIEKGFVPKNRLRAYYGYGAGFLVTPYTGLNRVVGFTVTGKVTYEYNDAVNPDIGFNEKGGRQLDLFVNGIAGIEYFLLPKISINGEFSLWMGTTFISERKRDNNEGGDDIIIAPSKEFNILPKASGDLVLSFYF